MHVAVENQHATDTPAFQQVTADDRQIIEDAKARRVVVVGVMGATGQVAGQPVAQCLLGGEQRAADGANGAPRQGFAPGQAQTPLVFTRQLARHIALDVRRIMGKGEDIHRAQRGAKQVGVPC